MSTRTAPQGLAEHGPAAAVGLVAVLGLLVLGATTGQLNWQVYAASVVLGTAVVTILHRRVGLSRPTVWGSVVFGVTHVAGGMVPVGDGILYQWWLVEDVLRYDNLQHAWGFGFVGRATWEAFRPLIGPGVADLPAVALWLVVLGASTFGAANEILEYGLTLALPATNVGGYDNTARDLVANLVGGLLVGYLTARRLSARRVTAREVAAEEQAPHRAADG